MKQNCDQLIMTYTFSQYDKKECSSVNMVHVIDISVVLLQ